MIIAHNLPSNEPGKTWKELNMEKQHKYPLGALVEINYGEAKGARLFVVCHTRDCDGTPLYILSHERNAMEEENEFIRIGNCHGGYGEDSLDEVMTGINCPHCNGTGVKNENT